MSGRGQPKPAAHKPRPLSEAESKAQKKQLEHLQADSKALREVEIFTPFQDLRDAVARLVPFHVLAYQDGEEADLEETNNQAGANLMCSRRESWLDMCLARAHDYCRKLETIRDAVEAADERYIQTKELAEEAVVIERLLLDDAHAQLDAAKEEAHFSELHEDLYHD